MGPTLETQLCQRALGLIQYWVGLTERKEYAIVRVTKSRSANVRCDEVCAMVL